MAAEVDHIMQQANLPSGPSDAPNLSEAAPRKDESSAPPAVVAAPPSAESVPAIAGNPSETTGLLADAAPPAVSAESAAPAANGLTAEAQPAQIDETKPAEISKPVDAEILNAAKPAQTEPASVDADEAVPKDDAQDKLPLASGANKSDDASSAPTSTLPEPTAKTATGVTAEPAVASATEAIAASSDSATALTNGTSNIDNAASTQDSNDESEPAAGEKRGIEQVAETNGAGPAKKAKTDEALAPPANGDGAAKKAGRPKKDKKAAVPVVGRTERKTRSQGPAA